LSSRIWSFILDLTVNLEATCPASFVRKLCVAANVVLMCAAAPVHAQDATQRDGSHDFDFAMGHWQVHLRKLMHPLTSSTEWVDYTGTALMGKIWGERANTEEFKVASLDGKLHIEFEVLRLYNPQTHQWSVFLANAAEGKLMMPAMIGSFKDGRGELYDTEDFGGKSILVRYLWTQPTSTTSRMVQSFSPDWGRTWEANWICDFSPPA
jgi:hypothetical protein